MLRFILKFSGEFAALGGAALWAGASFVFGRIRRQIPSLELNFLKCTLALILVVLTLLLQNKLSVEVENYALIMLMLSGILGLGLGDTAFLEAVHYLGARRVLLIGILAPPAAGMLAFFFLGERLPIFAWLGIAVTMAGVGWVVLERQADGGSHDHVAKGLGFALLYTLFQAAGSVLSRAALTNTRVDLMMSVLIRMGAGVAVLLGWMLVKRKGKPAALIPHLKKEFWGLLLLTTFFGTYIAIYLQQVALKFAETGIAQTLLMTSHLFILPIAIWSGERVSRRAILGALIATAGIVMLFVT